jgi:hypothetical protein
MKKLFKKDVTLDKIWLTAKSNFVLGKDYIETETRDYIVFCPFNYSILSLFQELLKETVEDNHPEILSDCGYKMSHCVCNSLGAYVYWYDKLYQDGRLKTFFIKKNLDITKGYDEQPLMAEFTGWIDFEDPHFLHFAHLVNNELATGQYVRYEAEYAYSRYVNPKYKWYVDRMNSIASEAYKSLFEQYDKYIDSLEGTLHNIMDEYA